MRKKPEITASADLSNVNIDKEPKRSPTYEELRSQLTTANDEIGRLLPIVKSVTRIPLTHHGRTTGLVGQQLIEQAKQALEGTK